MKTSTMIVGALGAALLSAGAALAEYPEKPVNFVVPWPPGDLEDVLTRMIAEDFQNEYGVPAAVINKPGGGGGPFPGAIEVAMAPAGGAGRPPILPMILMLLCGLLAGRAGLGTWRRA